MVLDYFAASGRLAVTDESRNSALYQKILKKLGLRTEARQQVHLSGSKRMLLDLKGIFIFSWLMFVKYQHLFDDLRHNKSQRGEIFFRALYLT